MTLEEIKAAVLSESKRVDMESTIHRLVRQAITQVHCTAFFDRDIVEDFIKVDAGLTSFKIPLPPLWRKFVCIKPMTAQGQPIGTVNPDGAYLHVDSSDVVDYYGAVAKDCYYIAGSVAVINATNSPTHLNVQWYALPEVADNKVETWLMREQPDIFIDWTMMKLYERTGRDDIAARLKTNLVQIDLPNLHNSYATTGEM